MPMKKVYLCPCIQVKLVAMEGTLLVDSFNVSDSEVDKYASKERVLAWDDCVNS